MAVPYGPGGPGRPSMPASPAAPAMPPIMGPPRPAVSNPLMGGGGSRWANPLLYAGLGMLSQGWSTVPQSPFAGLASGLQMGMQANALAAEQARQNEELELRREEAAAKRAERERLAEARTQAKDVFSQMAGAREMAGPLPPGQARPLVEGLSDREGALRLMGLPGYESIGAQMLGNQMTAGYREAALEETVRSNLANEELKAASLLQNQANAAAKAAADAAKEKAKGNLKTKEAYDIARKEMAPFAPQRDALLRIKSFLENPGPLSDVSALVAYAKILDPTSVVRESETAALNSAQGIVDRISAVANQWAGKGALPPNLRQEMVERVNDLAAIYQTEYDATSRDTAAILEQGNIEDPSIYLGAAPTWPQVTMPQVSPSGVASPNRGLTIVPSTAPPSSNTGAGSGGPIRLGDMPRR